MDAPATSPIPLLLLDEHAMFRQSLARVLEKEAGFKVAAQFADPAEALAQISAHGPALVLLDLGAERALQFVEQARKTHFAGFILVVTGGMTGPEAIQLIQAGVAGITHKHHSVEALCATIRQVAAGEVYLEPVYLTSVFRALDRSRPNNPAKLTERDKVVLRLVLQGLTNRQISTRLRISESGAKSALRQLFDKLGVRTRAQLVKAALERYRDQL